MNTYNHNSLETSLDHEQALNEFRSARGGGQAGGNIQIWLAPIVYAAGYGLVIFNSLRLVRFGEEYGEAEEARRRIEDATPLKPQRAMATS